MKFVLIDFETESACDLKKAGAWVYAEHPTTNIICLGYTPDGAGVVTLYDSALLFDLRRTDRAGTLEQAAGDPDVIFIAHNAAFEKAIWRNVMVAVLGWPDIADERWHCTQSVCAMKGLPLKLERAASALRLAMQKDTSGTAATLALGRVSKKGKNKGYYDITPEKLQRVYDYCAQDVKAELELHRRVRGLGAAERKVWLLDQKINQRGVCLDLDFVRKAQQVCDEAAAPLAEEFQKLTGGISVTQDKQFKAWLVNEGCPFPIGEDGKPAVNLKKETVLKLLGEKDEDEEDSLTDTEEDYFRGQERQEPLPFAYRRPLEIRRILNSASIKKLGSMLACCGSDGRARGLLQYHGAGPGRWAGRLLQPQNFPRPTLKIGAGWNADGTEKFAGHDPEQLVAAIMTGDAEYVRMLFGEPILACSNALRHAIIAAPGHLLEVGDFAQVEARIVLAMAGQHDKTALMAAGQSPYIPMAESIFGRKIDKYVDVAEYTIGKNTVLGCGFQMGAPKFRSRYAPDKPIEYAQAAIDAYRKEFAPCVPKLWRGLEEAATKTVWDRRSYEAYGIQYALEDGFLTARLHSGRKLWYYDPRPVRKAMPWDKDDIRPGFEYSTWKMGRWIRRTGYGGLQTENVVQGIARDLLVNAMFNCEAENHPVVLTSHDEDVNDVPEKQADAELLNQLMCDIPGWAKSMQIPIQAETWTGSRYRK